MKEFIKKYYIQIIIIALLFASIIFLFMQARQIMVLIGEKSVELKKIQLDRVIAAEFLQNVHVFKKNSNYIDENVEIFNILLPNTDDAKVKLFSDLERMAAETNNAGAILAIQKVDPKKDVATKADILSLSISFFGSYDDLMAFVTKIENMTYFSRITSFSIAKTPPRAFDSVDGEVDFEAGEKREDLLKTNMNINFYLDN